jgi:Flp pilus assembly protein TadG
MRASRRIPSRRLRPQREGIAAAEFALMLPFLALAFLAAVDFCRVFYATQTIQASANSAVLYASGVAKPAIGVSRTDAATNAAVAAGASLSPPLTAANVAVQSDSTIAQATVSYPFRPFVQIPGIPSTITLVRSATANPAPLNPGEAR